MGPFVATGGTTSPPRKPMVMPPGDSAESTGGRLGRPLPGARWAKSDSRVTAGAPRGLSQPRRARARLLVV